ncbi:MAG: 50S ribosomal protein L17 [Clostridia bacterium]|nr:50S ribosomal protein L17 [Clostridia bacterium]MBQ8268507.1 50S ribosomal protein L17 [Clostridia bacterium]MBR2325323.1 50S ribosomal protein L17 [Clostridia bacterium]
MTMRKLGRTTAQRKAMLRGMVTLLLENGKVETTYTRAQELSAKADEMITLGKKGTLAAYRDALAYITKEDVAKKVFSVIAPAYADLNGGYTQVLKMGPRRGDGAEMAIVKLVAVKAAAAEEAAEK